MMKEYYITLKTNKQDILNAFSAFQSNILLIFITYFTVKKNLKWTTAKLQTTVKNTQINTHLIKKRLRMNIQITSQNSTTITAHHLTAMATKHINVCGVDFVTSSCDLH